MSYAGNFISKLRAIASSGRFTAYTDGLQMALPTGESVFTRVKRTSRSIRPVGLRFSKYSFITEIMAGDYVGFGFGEAESELLAVQKSIAEGVERALFRAMKDAGAGTGSSNGWAAHLNEEHAFRSGLDELLERDAVLVHWLAQKPMSEVSEHSWPTWLSKWAASELSQSQRFSHLHVLISHLGHIPTVTTVLMDNDGHAVLSHATAGSLDEAVYKALAETCRIAQMAQERIAFDSSAGLADEKAETKFRPGDHAMFYAFHEIFPTWIFGETSTWALESKKWKSFCKRFDPSKFNAKFHQVAGDPLVIGYVTCDLVQSLFFGRTQEAQSRGLINVRRLREVMSEGELNPMPHCVP